jgi:hypothetical protein
MDDNLIDAKQLADFLAVPVTWVWAATRNERIPYIKVGRYLRFDCEAVLARLPKGGVIAAEGDNVVQLPRRNDEELSPEQGNIV